MNVYDLTHCLMIDEDFIITAYFFCDISLIKENNIVYIDGFMYKILDWEYYSVKQEAQKVKLILEKLTPCDFKL